MTSRLQPCARCGGGDVCSRGRWSSMGGGPSGPQPSRSKSRTPSAPSVSGAARTSWPSTSTLYPMPSARLGRGRTRSIRACRRRTNKGVAAHSAGCPRRAAPRAERAAPRAPLTWSMSAAPHSSSSSSSENCAASGPRISMEPAASPPPPAPPLSPSSSSGGDGSSSRRPPRRVAAAPSTGARALQMRAVPSSEAEAKKASSGDTCTLRTAPSWPAQSYSTPYRRPWYTRTRPSCDPATSRSPCARARTVLSARRGRRRGRRPRRAYRGVEAGVIDGALVEGLVVAQTPKARAALGARARAHLGAALEALPPKGRHLHAAAALVAAALRGQQPLAQRAVQRGGHQHVARGGGVAMALIGAARAEGERGDQPRVAVMPAQDAAADGRPHQDAEAEQLGVTRLQQLLAPRVARQVRGGEHEAPARRVRHVVHLPAIPVQRVQAPPARTSRGPIRRRRRPQVPHARGAVVRGGGQLATAPHEQRRGAEGRARHRRGVQARQRHQQRAGGR
eukprot:scaffold1836_cov282-Prasinococcus_capsulatus_cf.AAC.2